MALAAFTHPVQVAAATDDTSPLIEHPARSPAEKCAARPLPPPPRMSDQAGKGDKPRPIATPPEQYAERWARTFGSPKPKDAA